MQPTTNVLVLQGTVSCLVVLTLLGATINSCGGGSGSGGVGGNNGPYSVVGNWQASCSAAVGATTSGYGAIDSSGLAAFFDTSGDIVQLPTITGAKSFSGNVTAYAVNGNSDSPLGTGYSVTSICSFSIMSFSRLWASSRFFCQSAISFCRDCTRSSCSFSSCT